MSVVSSPDSRATLPRTTGAADRGPDVVELKTVRDARHAAPAAAGWECAGCDLVAGGFTALEAAFLAAVHDRVMHGSAPTARLHPGAEVTAEAS